MGNATVHNTWADTHCCFGLVQQLGRLGSGRQPHNKTGEGLDPRHRPAAVARSGEQRRGEVGPWVGEEGGPPGGAGNDNYNVRKVSRWAARSRGTGRGERRRGVIRSLVVEHTWRLRLDGVDGRPQRGARRSDTVLQSGQRGSAGSGMVQFGGRAAPGRRRC
jgi:hypothetical protein